jgi:hypothetical protein
MAACKLDGAEKRIVRTRRRAGRRLRAAIAAMWLLGGCQNETVDAKKPDLTWWHRVDDELTRTATAVKTSLKDTADWLTLRRPTAASPEAAREPASSSAEPETTAALPIPIARPPQLPDAILPQTPQVPTATLSSPPAPAATVPQLAILGVAADGAVEAAAPQLQVRLQRTPDQREARFTVHMKPSTEPGGAAMNDQSVEIIMMPGQQLVQQAVSFAPIVTEQPSRLIISAVLRGPSRETLGKPIRFTVFVVDRELDAFLAVRAAANPRAAGLAYLQQYPDARHREQVTQLVAKIVLAELSSACNLARDLPKIDPPDPYRTQLEAIRRDRAQALEILDDAKTDKVSGLYQARLEICAGRRHLTLCCFGPAAHHRRILGRARGSGGADGAGNAASRYGPNRRGEQSARAGR